MYEINLTTSIALLPSRCGLMELSRRSLNEIRNCPQNTQRNSKLSVNSVQKTGNIQTSKHNHEHVHLFAINPRRFEKFSTLCYEINLTSTVKYVIFTFFEVMRSISQTISTSEL